MRSRARSANERACIDTVNVPGFARESDFGATDPVRDRRIDDRDAQVLQRGQVDECQGLHTVTHEKYLDVIIEIECALHLVRRAHANFARLIHD